MNTQEYTSDRIRRIQSAQNTVKYVCIVGIHENTTTIFGGEYTRIWGETPLLPVVAETGSGLTLLTCQTVRFFCLIPQDTCLSYCTRAPVCPAHARARPCLQRDRLHRLIHRHGWRSRDVERRFLQNRLPRAGMCCPRRCSPPNSPLVPNPIRRPHRVPSILPLPRTPGALQDAAPARCVEEVVF